MRRLPQKLAPLALAGWVLACSPALSGDDDAPYPAGPHAIGLGATLPNLTFEGVTEEGAIATLALRDYHAPGSDDLLLIAVSGGLWCGTCRWPAEHPREVLDDTLEGRTRRLDLVVGDRDNAPADADAASRWQERFGLEGVAVGADPAYRLGAVLDGQAAALPLFVVVEASSMRVVDYLANPAPAALRRRLRRALDAPDETDDAPLVDGFFEAHEWALLQETTLPAAAPPDPSNAVADVEAAAVLGRALFFDAGLSPSGTVSCASCHRPEAQLADDLRRARGVAEGDRRTPPIALSAHARWQFWDGRADSLWAQALGPLENPLELDGSRVFVARRVLSAHGDAYRAAFPETPLPDTSTWPANGKPGDDDYDRLSDHERDVVTRVFVQAGKAIAAWERTLRVAENPLDAYLGGDLGALDPEQKYGLQLFVRSGCVQCHWGPRLTDDAFHNIRAPTGRRDGAADRGRADGIRAWRDGEFRRDGRWSDDPMEMRSAGGEAASLLGQFKTPPLRGVADVAFLGHGGSYDDLASITEAYGWGGVAPDDPVSVGTRDRWLVPFGETVQWGLVPFLELLTARPILR